MTVNLTRIYTRLGDDGDTHLGDMSRVSKTTRGSTPTAPWTNSTPRSGSR